MEDQVKRKMFLMIVVHRMERYKTNLINTKMMKITQVKDRIMLKNKKNSQAINPKRNSTCFQERRKKKSFKGFI